MKKFAKLDPELIREPITALFKRLGKKISHLSFLGRGEDSAVYRVNSSDHFYCLKTALYPERTQKVLNEAKIRNKFIDQGLKFVPHPRYSDQKFFKKGAVLYDYVEGQQAKFDSKNSLAQMARYQAEIHNLNFQINPKGVDQIFDYYRFLEEIIQKLQAKNADLLNTLINEAFSRVLKEYKTIIESNLELFPFGISSILHGDLSDNFITDPDGKLWLIDWENSEYGDSVNEICTFVYDNDIQGELRDFFFSEYQKHFKPAAKLNFKKISTIYFQAVPIFNLCWGMDQLGTNLLHNLEPERKLRDIALSANNWGLFYSESATSLITNGIAELTSKLEKENKLNLPLSNN
jgi:thiamine kinase-like enzyme